MAPLRALSLSIPAVLAATFLAIPPGAGAHETGTHAGFQSSVSYIKPHIPGLIVQVLGGHERLSMANLTKRNIVIFDGRGRPLERVPPGRTRVWTEPRIGAREPPPEREGLIRYWRIRGTADGKPFEIVGFLGYRPPAGAPSESDGLPTWALVSAGAAGLLLLAATLVIPSRRRQRG
jgi:hypothetical protein